MAFADKTANSYEILKEEYNKFINNNVTKTYQRMTTSTKKKIDKETKKFFAKKLENKTEQYADQSAYVTLKDHKENFKTTLPCQLINPAKSEIGIVSKVELEKVNRPVTNQNVVKSSPKQYIVEFYSSTTDKLLDNVVFHAKASTTAPAPRILFN